MPGQTLINEFVVEVYSLSHAIEIASSILFLEVF